MNPLGNSGRSGPIDQAGGEDFLGGGAAFALHEPAGEFAGGGAALAVIDLEREEIDSFAGIGPDDRAENDGVAISEPSPRRRPVWPGCPVSIGERRPPIWRSTLMACIVKNSYGPPWRDAPAL